MRFLIRHYKHQVLVPGHPPVFYRKVIACDPGPGQSFQCSRGCNYIVTKTGSVRRMR